MTEEQFQNTANFILACQARTEATIERIVKLSEENAVQIRENTGQIRENAVLIKENGSQIRALKDQIDAVKDACSDLLAASINQSKRLDCMEDPRR